MAVLLHSSNDLPRSGWQWWVNIGTSVLPGFDPGRYLPDIPEQLDTTFDLTAAAWLALGAKLGSELGTNAALAHTPACAPNVSDFGVMLAWTQLVSQWSSGPDSILVVCDDPWLFRHLALLPGIRAGKAPRLAAQEFVLALRGFAARTAVALRMIRAWLRLRRQRDKYPNGAAAILVYGHPASRTDGYDGYFGSLLNEVPSLRRVLHVDCPAGRALELATDGRTVSLHAWGNLAGALKLPFVRWRPNIEEQPGSVRWLVRRAAALEGSTGQAAAIRWQQLCQRAWLRASRPRIVSWPWENHAWERAFVVEARNCGTRTAAYQHTPFGRQDLSFHSGSNPAGESNVPDIILATGLGCVEALCAFGYPRERITIVGSLRHASFSAPPYDPNGPVFFALPYHLLAAPQMVDAALRSAGKGRCVLVKPHPMAPAHVASVPSNVRTDLPFSRQPGLAAVIFTASSIGLEALAGGIPAIRFLPEGGIALDPLPPGVKVPTADGRQLEGLLQSVGAAPVDIGLYYAPVDLMAWRCLLGP